MDPSSKSAALLALDVLIRVGCAVAVIYLLWNTCVSLRRGYVFINGKVATRRDESLGFWFGIVCWIGAGSILAMVVFRVL